jgi:hypothetical protein
MKLHLACLLGCLSVVSSVGAADYRVEPLDDPAPSDELSAEIAATLSPKGMRIIRGTKTTYCDIWLCKEWAAKADFKPTPEVLYPFTPGQLIGVAKFSRKGADFRDQDVGKGVYTLRYAQQPVDGAHVGTSLTRDFLLVLSAEVDKSAALLAYEDLTAQSAEAAGSSHPALFSMQRTVKAKRPSMRHNDEHDWWIVGFRGKLKGAEEIPVELVIVGVAAE